MSQTPPPTNQQPFSGSPPAGEPEFLVVGKLHRPHGVRGEILVSVWSDSPERLVAGARFYAGETHLPVQIKSVRTHQNELLVTFEAYHDREQVALLRNQMLYSHISELPALAEDEYYLHQLIGLQVINAADETVLGEIVQVLETGANDVYVVRPQFGKEILIPAIESVVLDLDFEKGQARVQLMPGLLPE
ncbi:MAG: 16S rRNA processing protein RimM [Anaerolineales bacterium]|nr:16S rRNA processing protein RimM [Anaerolineales bacterium]